jgi:hypothetical protein
MFIRGGFARDCKSAGSSAETSPLTPSLLLRPTDQWTAQNLGIRHFAVRHDEYSTAPNEPKVDYPEGFQGTGITVKGEVVAQLIDDRLAGKI